MRNSIIVALALLAALILAGVLMYSGVLPLPGFLNRGEPVEQNKYEGDLELSLDPGYARSKEHLAAGNIGAAVEDLRSIQDAYPPGTDARNVIDYSIALYYAFSSTPEKAIDAFKLIALDTSSYNAVTRALAIEGIGRIYFSTHDLTLLERAFSGEPYFAQLLVDAGGDKEKALYALLEQGFEISPTPITAIRLAAKTSLDILHTKPLSDEARSELMSRFDRLVSAGLAEAEKMNTVEGYGPYLSDFYSSYAGAIQTLVFAKVPMKYSGSDIESGYQRAYTLASDAGKPFVLFRAASFLSIVSPRSPRIADLTGRLIALPQGSRALFDTFVINTYINGESDVAYGLFPPYRKASPAFDAYVRTLVGR